MPLDGLLADRQECRYLLGAQTLGQTLEDLTLTRGRVGRRKISRVIRNMTVVELHMTQDVGAEVTKRRAARLSLRLSKERCLTEEGGIAPPRSASYRSLASSQRATCSTASLSWVPRSCPAPAMVTRSMSGFAAAIR